MKNNNISAGCADINTFSASGGGGTGNISLRLAANNKRYSACGGGYDKGELSEFPLTPPRDLEHGLALLYTNGEKRANKKLSIRAGRPAGLAAVGCYLSPLGRLNYRQCAAVSRAARSAAVCKPRDNQGGGKA